MKGFIRLGLIFIFLIFAGFDIRNLNFEKAKNNNVCKELKGKVLLYLIFVDSDETFPWTEFDIETTLDSVNNAVKWLEKQAKNSNIILNIKTDYYIGTEKTTVKRDLPKESVKISITEPDLKQGIHALNYWADRVVREVGESLPVINKEGLTEIDKPRNKERLVAYLRDYYHVESVALFFMVNNYFKKDISVPMNILTSEDVEFSIVSYKYSSVVAHNLLHLFGAADLYETPFRHSKKKIDFAKKEFPSEIMHDPYGKSLNQLNISEFTKYLIGWSNDLDAKYKTLLKDKLIIDF
jgi:hypothetical protein